MSLLVFLQDLFSGRRRRTLNPELHRARWERLAQELGPAFRPHFVQPRTYLAARIGRWTITVDLREWTDGAAHERITTVVRVTDLPADLELRPRHHEEPFHPETGDPGFDKAIYLRTPGGAYPYRLDQALRVQIVSAVRRFRLRAAGGVLSLEQDTTQRAHMVSLTHLALEICERVGHESTPNVEELVAAQQSREPNMHRAQCLALLRELDEGRAREVAESLVRPSDALLVEVCRTTRDPQPLSDYLIAARTWEEVHCRALRTWAQIAEETGTIPDCRYAAAEGLKHDRSRTTALEVLNKIGGRDVLHRVCVYIGETGRQDRLIREILVAEEAEGAREAAKACLDAKEEHIGRLLDVVQAHGDVTSIEPLLALRERFAGRLLGDGRDMRRRVELLIDYIQSSLAGTAGGLAMAEQTAEQGQLSPVESAGGLSETEDS